MWVVLTMESKLEILQLCMTILVSLNCWRVTDTSTQRSSSQVQSVFTAAVYEHPVIMPRNRTIVVSRLEALENMMKNLMFYQQNAEMAAKQGADIIVFPEVGLYGFGYTRASQRPYLEFIPDPTQESWNPCNEPERHTNSEVQQFLSCIAKNGSMYVVANIGDIQPCEKKTDPDCPIDERYQYNTNVVYDKMGTLVARYHKQHLFYEYQFDTPKTAEHIYFDTPFGRFGVFTCFDIMFKEPAVTLITVYNVTNVVFPTAWMDALPLLAAMQFHSAFAAGLGSNMLAANLHIPAYRFHGSGIYTPTGAVTYYYNEKTNTGKLLVHEVKTINKPLGISGNNLEKELPVSVKQDRQFSSSVFQDSFTFVPIDPSTKNGSASVCQNSLCCEIKYKFSETANYGTP